MVIDGVIDGVTDAERRILASIRNVAAKLTSGTYKTNDKTVGSYINYLCRSFLFYPIQRYDIKGKKYLESNKKYY